MELIIAADLVPTKSNIELFNNADTEQLLGRELLSIWNSVDIRIFNLEVPLTDKEDPIQKCGPNLIAPLSTINGIKALRPSLCALANNHILDQGEHGLKSTMEVLKRNNISFIGVGNNISEASKTKIIEVNKIKIGIYNCAENEFTIATKNHSGANPFDPLESFDHIKKLKEECDYIIVLYHGGKEHYRYPSPYIQRICRKMVESGADLVVCQHSHCIGCLEEYKNSNIIYGQGNFIFDYDDSEFWKTSILIKIIIDEKIKIEYIPIIKDKNVIKLATGDTKKKILEEFMNRSNEILKENFIENKYQELAISKKESYLRSFSSFNIWLMRIDKYILRNRLLQLKYNKKKLLRMQNYIECEAHRELVLAALKGERA